MIELIALIVAFVVVFAWVSNKYCEFVDNNRNDMEDIMGSLEQIELKLMEIEDRLKEGK